MRNEIKQINNALIMNNVTIERKLKMISNKQEKDAIRIKKLQVEQKETKSQTTANINNSDIETINNEKTNHPQDHNNYNTKFNVIKDKDKEDNQLGIQKQEKINQLKQEQDKLEKYIMQNLNILKSYESEETNDYIL